MTSEEIIKKIRYTIAKAELLCSSKTLCPYDWEPISPHNYKEDKNKLINITNEYYGTKPKNEKFWWETQGWEPFLMRIEKLIESNLEANNEKM